MLQRLFILIILASSSLCGNRLPDIEPKDAVTILEDIMEAHATQKTLSSQLILRAFNAYLTHLDPLKTYFLKQEVKQWENASEEELTSYQKAIVQGDFTPFTAIHHAMVTAIERRTRLEKEIERMELPQNVSPKEFKEMAWAESEEELKTRLSRIKALQLKTAEKLDGESKEKALQRLTKRRIFIEEEIATTDAKEKEKLILTHALKALASSFDTHTAYFTPLEASQFMIAVQQRLFGIGAQLRDDMDGFTIVKIIEGSPAQKSALKINDKLIAINDEPIIGMEILDAVELIRGEEGTTIQLTILRPQEKGEAEKLLIDVCRGEVVIQEARIESKTIPFGDGIIALITLHSFYQDPIHSSAGDCFEVINTLKKDHKIKGIVLDLRDNSGGVLPQAVAVTGLFITKGIVVGIKDNTGVIEYLREINGKTIWDGPLVVLTSKASASAAEIVAQTLQDYGRAIIVGDEHTYGKGTFQTFTLDSQANGKVNPKGEFKVTRGRYYTVSGKSPQLVGVKPDVLVPGPTSTLPIGEEVAENPLENDSIPENFKDDLSDIPPLQRDQISWLYRFNLQPKLTLFTKHLPLLQKNSETRLKQDKLYQKFLSELKKEEDEDISAEVVDLYISADLQLKEALNVTKDLILLAS